MVQLWLASIKVLTSMLMTGTPLTSRNSTSRSLADVQPAPRIPCIVRKRTPRGISASSSRMSAATWAALSSLTARSARRGRLASGGASIAEDDAALIGSSVASAGSIKSSSCVASCNVPDVVVGGNIYRGNGPCSPETSPPGPGNAESPGVVEGSSERSWVRVTVPVVGGEIPLARGVAPE